MVPASLPDLNGLDLEAMKALVLAKHGKSIKHYKELTSSAHEIEHLKLIIEKYRRMICRNTGIRESSARIQLCVPDASTFATLRFVGIFWQTFDAWSMKTA